MKSLKKLAGMIGLVILLCGIMTGCSGKRLYSEEELTQIHDVVGAVEQITKEFQYVMMQRPPQLFRPVVGMIFVSLMGGMPFFYRYIY